jgi:hypothetical protein
MYLQERPAPGFKGPIPKAKDFLLKNPGKGEEPFKDVEGTWARQDEIDSDMVSTGSPSLPLSAALVPMERVESELTPPTSSTSVVDTAP